MSRHCLFAAVVIVALDYSKVRRDPSPDYKLPYTIPEKYTSVQTSDLTVTIPDDSSSEMRCDFELTD